VPYPSDIGCLAIIGKRYSSARADALSHRKVGLTKLYNGFHENDSGLQELRELHVQLDRAIAAAYGWNFDLGHGFHETKRGTRFTISPQSRTKVLDLLLDLNHERYAAEHREAEAAPKGQGTKRKRKPEAKSPLRESPMDQNRQLDFE